MVLTGKGVTLSWRATGAVKLHSEAVRNARLLLFCMADIADEYGIISAYISHLAEGAKLDRATVIRQLQNLEELGEVETYHRGGQSSNVWILKLEGLKPWDEDAQELLDFYLGERSQVATGGPRERSQVATSDQSQVATSQSDNIERSKDLESKNFKSKSLNQELETSDPRVQRIVNLLRELMGAIGAKVPDLNRSMLRDARLLFEKDERDIDEAEAILRWALNDSFWQSNIHSISKFRIQYDKLKLQKKNRGDSRQLPGYQGYRDEDVWGQR